MKIQRQLSKDKIRPPQWPSNPGSHAQRQAMDSFRESYRAYREKARKSLIRAGLVDDPDRRRKLDQALDFRGIAEDMCPEWEKITRITEYDVRNPEKALDGSGDLVAIPELMVKRLARSAAGQDAPLPMDVRSFATLRKTLDYLIDDLIPNDSALPSKHNFLWDRTRAIRIDLSVQKYNLTNDERTDLVYCLETIARFHVTSLHLLSQEGFAAEDFSEQQEIEQLGKTLMSLKELYDDCVEQGIECENEAEFRAYYIVFNARNPSIKETVEGWGTRLWDSDGIRTAMCLVESLQNTWALQGPLHPYAPTELALSAAAMFFSIVSSPQISYTMACFAEIHFNDVRKTMLRIIRKAYYRPGHGPKDITPAFLQQRMRFDTEEEGVDFAQKHGIEFGQEGDQQYAILNSRQPVTDPRIRHAFSRTIVEIKRSGRSLPDVIHHTVYQEHRDEPIKSPEDSLFVAEPVDTPVPTIKNSFVGTNEADGSTMTAYSGAAGTFSPKSSPTTVVSSPLPRQFGSAAASPTVPPQTTDGAKPQASSSSMFGTFPPKPSGPAEATSIASPFLASGPATAASGAPTIPNPAAPSVFTSALTPSASDDLQRLGQKPVNTTPSQKSIFGSLFPPRAQENVPSNVPTPQPVWSSVFGVTPKFPSSSVLEPGTQATSTTFKFPSTTTTFGQPPSVPAVPQGSSPSHGLSTDKRPPAFAFTGNKASVPDHGPSVPTKKPTVIFALPPIREQSTEIQTTSAVGSSVTPGPFGPATSTTAGHMVAATPLDTRPKIDPMDNFARWMLLADKGMLENSLVPLAVKRLVESTWKKFVADEQERIRREKDEKSWAEALKFRHYNLRVRYFYRWLDISRKRRVVKRIHMAKEEARKWKAARLAEAREAAERAREEKRLENAKELLRRGRRHSEDVSRLRESTRSDQSLEEALLGTGVLDGVRDPRRAARKVIQDGPTDAGGEMSLSTRMRLRSENQRRRRHGLPPLKRFPEPKQHKDGSKTALLRAISSGRDSLSVSTASFRHSTLSSSYRSTPGLSHSRVTKPQSRVRDPYWRLKANGLIQMPNGEYLHESLALPMIREGKRYPGIGDYGLPPVRSYTPSETPPAGEIEIARDSASASPTPSRFRSSNEAQQKRKRNNEEEEDADLAAYRNEAPATAAARKRARSSEHSVPTTPGGDQDFLESIANLMSRVNEAASSAYLQ
ncbi:SAC3/GANP/Nin1/mts3/eIF-3 p25 family-domain-containing protein [Xylariaceae sp. FL0594]|nr:SAC3/GANP/Nin1/mts3/eIF-3 p25 family-domain-containing protein [Xylariaceae sp. FL0594]